MTRFPLPDSNESALTRAAKEFMEENDIAAEHLKSIEMAMRSGQIGFDGSTRTIEPVVVVSSKGLVPCSDDDL